jgi:LacI family transcriptional regulator
MNYKHYTMKDVAERAGVSITTVSHVINKTRNVDKNTSKRVLDAIEEFNYSISLTASSLRGKKTRLIGLIIPDVTNLVYAKLSRCIENAFFKKGYSVTLCNSEGNLKREKIYLEVLKSRNVDAIIIVPTSNEHEHLNGIMEAGIQLIVIAREIKGLEVDNIITDDFTGFYEATKYLIKLGHKKIGFIRRPYDLPFSITRFQGYLTALKENNIKFNKNFCPRANKFNYSAGYDAMSKILNLENKPTAIISFGDIAGIGAMKAITDNGFSIPKDFSIIGSDNILIDEYLQTTLTSISYPIEDFANEALDIFSYKLKDSTRPNKRIVLKPSFIIRDSVSSPNLKSD